MKKLCFLFTVDKKQSALKCFEKNDTFSLMWSSEQNADGAWFQASPGVPGVVLETRFGMMNLDWVHGLVICTRFFHYDHSEFAIFLTRHLFFDHVGFLRFDL